VTTLLVPPIEPVEERLPTLGPQVIDWIETYLCYGPGELKGEPYRLTPEQRDLIRRAYEVYPRDHKLAGRRRFKRVVWSLRKGTAKTELLALLAITEAHPGAPVRCDGWDASGQPVGVSVRSPYIPLVAFSLTQTEDLAYAVARSIVEDSGLPQMDPGMERIMVLDDGGREDGKIVPLGGSPNARDGARTTFQGVDESHRLYLPRLKKAHNIMVQNVYKRVGADAWTLEVTTAFDPGQGSVAEEAHAYAQQIEAGKVDDPRLFYYHRQATETLPLDTPEQVMTALVEASGPAMEWSGDLDALVGHYFEPGTDRAYFRRVWLNQPIAGAGHAFNLGHWNELATVEPPDMSEDDLIVIGFDGARRRDATALVATHVSTGYQWLLGLWERPDFMEDWEVPADEVDEAVDEAFLAYDVWRLYGDPPYWDDRMDAWAGKHGDDRIIKWWTNRPKPTSYAVRNFNEAIEGGLVTHENHPDFANHIGNAFREPMLFRDDEDRPLWLIRKERRESQNKIDAAMAAVLSWEARGDCVAKGMPRRKRRSKTLISF
jgi:phage terminase large subunit-like protein